MKLHCYSNRQAKKKNCIYTKMNVLQTQYWKENKNTFEKATTVTNNAQIFPLGPILDKKHKGKQHTGLKRHKHLFYYKHHKQ